jgi:hypothetical protein
MTYSESQIKTYEKLSSTRRSSNFQSKASTTTTENLSFMLLSSQESILPAILSRKSTVVKQRPQERKVSPPGVVVS